MSWGRIATNLVRFFEALDKARNNLYACYVAKNIYQVYIFKLKYCFRENNLRAFTAISKERSSSTSVYCYRGVHTLCIYGHTYSKSMDQLGKVANPARGQLNREKYYFHVPVRA